MIKKQYIIFVFFLVFILFLMSAQTEAEVGISSGLSQEREAQIGETYRDTIIIRNNGNRPQEVKIYQTDYLFFSDGTNIYGEPGKDLRSNANWITFSPHRLIIPPKETATINYTINVPDDKSLMGTYWSMMMVEGIGEEHPEASTHPEEGKVLLGITQVVRYGIQIITHIEDTGSRELKFTETKLLAKEDEGRIFQIDLENTGERWLVPLLWVEL